MPCSFFRSCLITGSALLVVGAHAASAPKPTVFSGETFVVRTIVDRQQNNLPYAAFKAPETWQVSGELRWKYEDVSNPVTAYCRAVNPAKPEAVTFFPQVGCFWLQGASAYNQPGTTALGLISAQPMSPPEAMVTAITKIFRPNLPSLRIVGVRDMPRLAQSLNVTDPIIKSGIGAKVTYEENGQQIEEEFYGLYYLVPIPYDGPQGRTIQTNWGLQRVHSFKAPLGTLDQRREVMAFMVHSVEVNPRWMEHAKLIMDSLNAQFQRNLAQGYANIAAAAALSRQISANNDAFIANIERQRMAANSTPAASSASRSANDRFDDYIRGVDTMNDPYTGTSQHSSAQQYHWTDGYGNYAHSNDASFNPNTTSNISWTQMTPAR